MRHGAPLHLPCPADRPIRGEGRRGLPRMTGGRTAAAATSVRLLGARHDLLRNSVLSSPSPDETCIGFLSFFLSVPGNDQPGWSSLAKKLQLIGGFKSSAGMNGFFAQSGHLRSFEKGLIGVRFGMESRLRGGISHGLRM